VTSSVLSIEKITHLLEGLNSLPPSQKHEPTFMEIAGYPHYENVCSNILQFYLQPDNEHGFDSLLLDSLFTLINENVVINGQNIDVRREESTDKGNRIDLVIESDDFVLGIENKLFADLYNDLDDYKNYLENKYLRKDRPVYKIVLSLDIIQPTFDNNLHGFKPITYALFFEKVIANIGSYFLTAREPHVIFLRDFIQTIQNLQRQTSMDKQRLIFFHENRQDLAKLLTEVDVLRKDMREKVKQLKELIAEEVGRLPYPVESGLWRSSDVRDFLWYTVKISDLFWLQVDVVITPAGWRIRFFKRKGEINDVKNWINAREIKYEISPTHGRLVYNNTLPYESNPEDTRTWVLSMLRKITAPIV
jgi:hypothetical protein